MAESQAEAAVNETLYAGMEDVVHRYTMNAFRDHVARVLGPSPFDFRGRHLMSREEAEKLAAQLVDRLEEQPDKGAAFMRSLYMPEGDDE